MGCIGRSAVRVGESWWEGRGGLEWGRSVIGVGEGCGKSGDGWKEGCSKSVGGV